MDIATARKRYHGPSARWAIATIQEALDRGQTVIICGDKRVKLLKLFVRLLEVDIHVEDTSKG